MVVSGHLRSDALVVIDVRTVTKNMCRRVGGHHGVIIAPWRHQNMAIMTIMTSRGPLQPRQTAIRRYDDSSNGGIDDDEHGGGAPDGVHEAGALLRVRSRAAVAAVVKWSGSVMVARGGGGGEMAVMARRAGGRRLRCVACGRGGGLRVPHGGSAHRRGRDARERPVHTAPPVASRPAALVMSVPPRRRRRRCACATVWEERTRRGRRRRRDGPAADCAPWAW